MSNVDEILRYKELLDSGIITKEEFEKKKKQLLELNRKENELHKDTEKKENTIKQKNSMVAIVMWTIILAFIFIGVIGGILSSGTLSSGVLSSGTLDNEKSSNAKFTLISKTGKTDSYGYTTITGEIKNNTNKTYSYAQVTFNLYDANGNQVGTAMDNINYFEANGIWKFEAIGFGSEGGSYKLVEIIGF